jgi:hypothetical protein
METKKLKKLLKRLRDKHSLLLSDRPYFYRMILAQRLEDTMSEYENDYYQDEEDVIADLTSE